MISSFISWIQRQRIPHQFLFKSWLLSCASRRGTTQRDAVEDLFGNKVKFLVKKKNYTYVCFFFFFKVFFLNYFLIMNLPLSKKEMLKVSSHQ